VPSTIDREVKLTDKYELADGEVFMTGLQALVRLPMVQRSLDEAAGLLTGTLISGYEGSPLAGYDLELARQRALLDENNIVVRPSVNEELAANAVQGSQLAAEMEDCEYDGVVGIWYGKAPGLDRASDALRHGNLGGAHVRSGALVLVGDDSVAKSSTVPSSSEVAIAELGMPVLMPSDADDIVSLGLHGIAMSRFSGLWVGMKLATNVVDGSGTAHLSSDFIPPAPPDRTIGGSRFTHTVSANFLQPNLAQLEASLFGARLELARRYVAENRLFEVLGDPAAKVGIVSSGAVFRDTMQALQRLGIGDRLDSSGVRVLKLGAIHPLDPASIREFADGLDELIVVEEKRAFIELAVKDILFAEEVRPAVHGRRGPDGTVLFRAEADLPPAYVAGRLKTRLLGHGIVLDERRDRPSAPQLLPIVDRSPYFCSGCPHNRSTVVPDGSLVGAGIGCHALAALMPGERVGDIYGMCQMGGEGGPWIGMAPFVSTPHLFQNIGDGTFHHSGSLAIRASVAAGTNITYKLLYNDAVAMTGGQQAVGKMSVPNIVAQLLAEGVRQIAITTEDVRRYRKVRLPRGVKVHDRSRLIEVQEQLAQVQGVTVLIHDQECATELRRKRKRKLVQEPFERAFINERVCEGCGDCGQKSNCMSVQPVQTEFGRKTRIDQSSCNKDYSCFDGDCPSFISVVPGGKSTTTPTELESVAALPEPVPVTDLSDFGLRIVGMGGTGVVTTAQVIATAATLAGVQVQGLDQLGMAQKGGAVVSDLRLSTDARAGTNKLAPGECDLYLGCDVLVAADASHLTVAAKDRTVAVVSTSQVPTGEMILSPQTPFPSTKETTGRISEFVRAEDSVFADARRISEDLLGSDQYANIMLVGMAVQAGALPLPVAGLEKAINLNGVAVQTNLRAFEIGRRVVVDPGHYANGPKSERRRRRKVATFDDYVNADLPDATISVVRMLAAELVDYQSRDYAHEFLAAVDDIQELETSKIAPRGEIAERFARSYFKLLAYKDEYEVARLSLDPALDASIRQQFGDGAKLKYRLHPPFLRALGFHHKIAFGRWFRAVFRLLHASRKLRGTRLDPFGYARVRRVERQLPRDFRLAAVNAMAFLSADTHDAIVALMELPELVRGYEGIKLANVDEYRRQMSGALAALDV